MLSTDIALDDFLDRKTEEETAASERLSERLPTIPEGSHEDSGSSTPQPQQTSHSELVLLSEYLLNEDVDLQEELNNTLADVD